MGLAARNGNGPEPLGLGPSDKPGRGRDLSVRRKDSHALAHLATRYRGGLAMASCIRVRRYRRIIKGRIYRVCLHYRKPRLERSNL